MITIGLVANVYNEANALPGWIETHIQFFDDVRVLHSGPQNEYSNDGTIEILEKWRIPIEFCAIDDGFGVVRTKAINMSPCDWVMILDADERFFKRHTAMKCEGQSTPSSEVDTILQSYDFRDLNTVIPNWENISKLGANLVVENTHDYDQFLLLKNLISNNPSADVVISSRRHWHDFSFKRPTQNWHTDPDWQARIVRNRRGIYFNPDVKMHEQLCGYKEPIRGETNIGPFFDHFHFVFKRMEHLQRSHDVAIYDRIHNGQKPPTWSEFR